MKNEQLASAIGFIYYCCGSHPDNPPNEKYLSKVREAVTFDEYCSSSDLNSQFEKDKGNVEERLSIALELINTHLDLVPFEAFFRNFMAAYDFLVEQLIEMDDKYYDLKEGSEKALIEFGEFEANFATTLLTATGYKDIKIAENHYAEALREAGITTEELDSWNKEVSSDTKSRTLSDSNKTMFIIITIIIVIGGLIYLWMTR